MCPVADLNDQQERASRVSVKRKAVVITFAKPALIERVREIQMKWEIQLGIQA